MEKIIPSIPAGFSLHNYQSAAVRGWLDNDGRGRFEMATGTGKTVTALAAAVQTAEQCEKKGETLLIVVCVPDNPLVQQWSDEAKLFGFEPVTSGPKSTNWRRKVLDELLQLKHRQKSCSFIVMNFEAALGDNQNLLRHIERHQSLDSSRPAKVMLIADEAHGLGSEKRKRLLLERYDYRLALTATFSRHFDEEGTALLEEYFKGHREIVSISDAIKKYKTLVPYRYHPVFVDLSKKESDKYKQLSLEISKLYGRNQKSSWADFEKIAQRMLEERADIIKHAEGKVAAFKERVIGLPDPKYMLVYAAEGTDPFGGEIRQDQNLLNVLRSAGLNAELFNGALDPEARLYLQKELDNGRVDGLVAMKCLDEGIDIPEARVAFFVASTGNPRQYVQRRGRVLRRPKKTDSTKESADLFDFIVVPPQLKENNQSFEVERKIVARELLRALELAESSLNSGYALGLMNDLMDRFGLHDLRFINEEREL